MIVEAILCDWCQKRIPPESGSAIQTQLKEENGNRWRAHFCSRDCYDKWCLAHKAPWEEFKE